MSDTAIGAFEFLADADQIFIKCARELEKQGVARVTHAIECKKYISPGLMISFWSEVKLKDDRIIATWIDLQPTNGCWVVDGRIAGFDDETLHRSESQEFRDFDEAQAWVKELITDLHVRVTYIVTQELSRE
ncbi:MAG: hypothetical protein RMN52_04510 [Anaerolineae bacterium]|nr:hypothetical protein [Candidatus Roseilinea sp.]MDW8449244.1 hypothetical protein [Anaerolineae bacterium]